MDLQTGINLLMFGAGLALVLVSINLFDTALRNTAHDTMKRKLTWVSISATTFITGTLITYLAFYMHHRAGLTPTPEVPRATATTVPGRRGKAAPCTGTEVQKRGPPPW